MAKYRPNNGTKYLEASWMLNIPECLLRTPVRCLTVLRLRQRPPLFGTRRPIAPKRIDRPGQTKTTTIVQLAATPVEREIYRRLEANETMQGLVLQMAKGKL